MYNHILIPVAFDGDHPTDPAIEIARNLVAQGGKVTFLHVMEAMPSYAINHIPKNYAEESRLAVQAALDEKATGFGNAKGVLVTGHGGRTILDWAAKRDVDLIIIASHRPGLSDYFLGSTAARVVRHATCGVHVLR